MSEHNSPIFPSVNMIQTQTDFGSKLMKISFSHKVHIDISDGQFVPTISFPEGEDFYFVHLKHFEEVEVHLMVFSPQHWIEYLADVTDTFIIHAEITDAQKMIDLIRSSHKKVGIALKPQTDIEATSVLLEQADMITVMSVKPGPDGSSFLPETLEKVSRLKELYPSKIIECDGSMNEHTIVRAKAAGANRFVAGSSIQNADFPQSKFQLLNELIKDE